MQSRTRQEQLIIRVTPEEKEIIQKKPPRAATRHSERNGSKMAIL